MLREACRPNDTVQEVQLDFIVALSVAALARSDPSDYSSPKWTLGVCVGANGSFRLSVNQRGPRKHLLARDVRLRRRTPEAYV